MDYELLHKGVYGKLELDRGYPGENHREITFTKRDALKISDFSVETIYYGSQEPQTDSQLSAVSLLETDLLKEEHTFVRKDMKRLVKQYGLSPDYDYSPYIEIEESGTIGVRVSTRFNEWEDDAPFFELTIKGINPQNVDERISWKINRSDESEADQLISLLEYICDAAKYIHEGRLQDFIYKMDMFGGACRYDGP